MENKNLKNKIDGIFKKDERFWDKEREALLRNTISDYAEKSDEKFLEMLLADKIVKEHFFKEVGKITVFDKEKFLAYINNKDFLENSYTKFTQNIGLTDEGQFLKSAGKVILQWPYKDCILEGGQTKEDQKRNEIFFNEILEKDEIDVLLKPKVFGKFKKYSLKNKKATGEKFEKFTRDENGTIKDNLIIKGNNLIVLHSLKEEFAGKVKLIYIDPPYNTGNDGFKYNDNFNHSSWLTFMKNRLEVARDLLADDGVIFVQCDDNEQAYLKVLMDEIFGRDNFVCNFIWKGKSGGANDSKYVAVDQEYILCFGKKIDSLLFNIDLEAKVSTLYNYEDENGKYSLDRLDKQSLGYIKSLDFIITNYDGKKYRVEHKNNNQKIARWRWSKKTVKERFNELVFKNGKVYTKNYKKDGSIARSLLVDERFSRTRTGKTEHYELFDEYLFSNPKPENLLKYLVSISTKENDIVLDFFAGSGTSGAVAHKMGRQYILVEQMDYIKDLPEARIKKVIEGEQGGISKAVNWKGGGEFVYMEMKEFNQEFLFAVKKAKNKEDLKKVYKDIKEKAFLSYRFTDERFKAKISEFDDLDLNEQKQVLAEILDKNLLYLSYSEMEDATYKINKKDIEINDNFYNEE